MTHQCSNKIKYFHVLWMVTLGFMVNLWTSIPVAAQDGQDSNPSRVEHKFRQIDINSDDLVSLSEMAAHEARIGKSGGHRFMQTDINKDGVISMDEFTRHESEKAERGSPGDPQNSDDRPPKRPPQEASQPNG